MSAEHQEVLRKHGFGKLDDNAVAQHKKYPGHSVQLGDRGGQWSHFLGHMGPKHPEYPEHVHTGYGYKNLDAYLAKTDLSKDWHQNESYVTELSKKKLGQYLDKAAIDRENTAFDQSTADTRGDDETVDRYNAGAALGVAKSFSKKGSIFNGGRDALAKDDAKAATRSKQFDINKSAEKIATNRNISTKDATYYLNKAKDDRQNRQSNANKTIVNNTMNSIRHIPDVVLGLNDKPRKNPSRVAQLEGIIDAALDDDTARIQGIVTQSLMNRIRANIDALRPGIAATMFDGAPNQQEDQSTNEAWAAGAASGALIGANFGGPIGAAIGGAAGGLIQHYGQDYLDREQRLNQATASDEQQRMAAFRKLRAAAALRAKGSKQQN